MCMSSVIFIGEELLATGIEGTVLSKTTKLHSCKDMFNQIVDVADFFFLEGT